MINVELLMGLIPESFEVFIFGGGLVTLAIVTRRLLGRKSGIADQGNSENGNS